jgi:hypothetical protein
MCSGILIFKMVRSSRFERPTHGFGDHCSIHLSYERKTTIIF